jgi:hypothetical protein
MRIIVLVLVMVFIMKSSKCSGQQEEVTSCRIGNGMTQQLYRGGDVTGDSRNILDSMSAWSDLTTHVCPFDIVQL